MTSIIILNELQTLQKKMWSQLNYEQHFSGDFDEVYKYVSVVQAEKYYQVRLG